MGCRSEESINDGHTYIHAQYGASAVWSGNKSPGRCTHEGEVWVVSYFAFRLPEAEREREAAGNDQYYDNSSLSRVLSFRALSTTLSSSTLLATLA